MASHTVTELTSLVNARRDAAFGCAGTAQVAIAFLNMGDVEKAVLILLQSVEEYQAADVALTNFQKKGVANGNVTAA